MIFFNEMRSLKAGGGGLLAWMPRRGEPIN